MTSPYGGHLGMSGNMFGCSSVEYCWNLINSDAAKDPSIISNKDYIIKINLVENVNSSEILKP